MLVKILLSISLAGSAGAQDRPEGVEDLYTFSSSDSCMVYGSWTAMALNATSKLQDLVTQIKDDPNCKGIESVVQDLDPIKTELTLSKSNSQNNDIVQRTDAEAGAKLEAIPAELSALFSFIKGSEDRNEVLKLMAQKTFGSAILKSQQNKSTDMLAPISSKAGSNAAPIASHLIGLGRRSQRVTKSGAKIIQNVFAKLPSYQECFVGRPAQGAAVLGALVGMVSAFASSGDGVISDMSKSIGSLTTLLQQRRFSTVLRELKKSEYAVSVSCLLESLSQNHCNNMDALALLDWGKKEVELRNPQLKLAHVDLKNPLAGFYLLVRVEPKVTAWLQRVQLAARPRLSTDADFKNAAWETIADTVKEVNRIWGDFNERKAQIKILTDDYSKKSSIHGMLDKLVSGIISADKRLVNFFTMTIPGNYLPFFLIGRNEIPKEVAANKEGKYQMEWTDYMLSDGKRFIEEFNEPEHLLDVISERLRFLIDGALDKANQYFKRFLIVDINNLAIEPLIDSNLSVLEGLTAIYNYLSDLEKRIEISLNRKDAFVTTAILPNLRDTRARIYEVLKVYQEVRKFANTPCKGNSDCLQQAQYRANVDAAYKKVIDTAYEQFNIMLQRDSFMSSRLSTFVSYDFSMRARTESELTQYEGDLIKALGESLLFNVIDVHGRDPSETLRDLSWAKEVSLNNLWSFESLFRDTLSSTIFELDVLEKNQNVTNWELTKQSWMRHIEESTLSYKLAGKKLKWFNPFQFFALGFFHPDRYTTYGTDNYVARRGENVFNSLANTKARLCVQTLAFQDPTLFDKYCKGSVLKGYYTDQQNKSLLSKFDVSYDNYNTLSRKSLGADDESICALRDGNRRNYVKWLSNRSRR